MLKYVNSSLILILWVTLLGSEAFGQSNAVVTKSNGKFQGSLSAHTSTVGDRFVQDIELQFVWSALFDQPTEYYLFTWTRAGSVNYAGTQYTRAQLSDYPDLQSRFDNLRPGSVKLRLDVDFAPAINPTLVPINGQCDIGFLDGNGRCRQSLSKVVTEIPHLMVLGSGRVGDNITPTSPPDNWVGFFETTSIIDDSEPLNQKLHAMMKRTDQLSVHNLKLVSYTLPYEEISAIFEDFHAREFEKEEEALDREAEAQKRAPSSKPRQTARFNEGVRGDRQKSAKGDLFWEDFGEATSNTSVQGGGSSSTSSDPKRSIAKIIIESHGVKNSLGEILIPYRDDWSIESYDDGLAEVSMHSRSKTETSFRGCGTVTAYFRTHSYVDRQGNFLTPLKEKWSHVGYSRDQNLPPFQKECPVWECGYDRADAIKDENARIGSEISRCKNRLREEQDRVAKIYRTSAR